MQQKSQVQRIPVHLAKATSLAASPLREDMRRRTRGSESSRETVVISPLQVMMTMHLISAMTLNDTTDLKFEGDAVAENIVTNKGSFEDHKRNVLFKMIAHLDQAASLETANLPDLNGHLAIQVLGF